MEIDKKKTGKLEIFDITQRSLRGTRQEVKYIMEVEERLALRDEVKEEKHSRDKRGVERRDRNEHVFARPNGLRESAESVISWAGGTWTCQKGERGIPVAASRRK